MVMVDRRAHAFTLSLGADGEKGQIGCDAMAMRIHAGPTVVPES